MSFPLAEYRVTRSIRESARSRVYEAVSIRDGDTVIAKVFDIEDESSEARVEHEFELIRVLEIEGVVRARELRRVGDELVLVLEHVPGVNLAEYCQGEPLALERFWPLAIQITDILAQTHAARVIHRDIKPTNVLVSDELETVHLADFGISVLLEHERRHIYDSEVFVGTLPYISPEQTGRTSRSVDFRSDLYSLGITFYELLTGRVPFESSAPLELIHAHLARRPRAPTVLLPELPGALSRLVLKLLEKAPEHRYQTAAGLAADLRALRDRWVAGEDLDDFELARDDRPRELQLPRQLYGRAKEQGQLSECVARVAEGCTRETVLLTGPAGVGKSALISGLEASVAGLGGYMTIGRFEAQRERPHAGFAEAVDGLFEQLLTESEARLQRWRRQLEEGLGNLAGVVAGLAPSLELIVGPQPKPPSLDGAEARNRLKVGLERLLAVVCAEGRPLVFVLEDLHWADRGSVELLESLSLGHHGPLLLLASLRSEALAEGHPLRAALAAIPEQGRGAVIELGGLASEAIEALLADTLGEQPGLDELARALTRKTDGVPLFVAQLLARLVDHGVLQRGKDGWSWELAEVEAEAIPDDAVAMMRGKLEHLSAEARALVRLAACVGARFDLRRLSELAELERPVLRAAIVELEDAGLIARVGGEYRFPHDGLRDAAQAELDDERRRSIHWRLGRQLLEAGLDDPSALFETVDHLDAGAPDEPDAALRRELAELDLRAGELALDRGADELARRYLGQGVALTRDLHEAVAARGPEAESYDLVFRLHLARARSLALSGRRDEADAAFAELLSWQLTDAHHAEAAARRIRLLWTGARHAEARALGRATLGRLGRALPRSPGRLRARVCVWRATRRMLELGRERIEAMAPCDDPLEAAIVEILEPFKQAAYVGRNTLYLYLAGVHARAGVAEGYHPSLPLALNDLAVATSGLGWVEDGARLLELARGLARGQPGAPREPRVLGLGYAMCGHRSMAFTELGRLLDAGYDAGLELGDFDSASFVGGFGADLRLELGAHLRVLDRRCLQIQRDVGRSCPNQMRRMLWITRGLSHELLGPDGEGGEPPARDEVWDLDPDQLLAEDGATSSYYVALTAKLLVEVVLGEWRAALATCGRFITKLERVLFNTHFVARAYALAAVAYYTSVLAGEHPPPAIYAAVKKGEGLLRRWAKHAPGNYTHHHRLVRGLRAACEGDSRRAMRHLDEAWERARERGCRWIEGLAAESLAAALERDELSALVEGARRRAWTAYAAWGAGAPLERLRGQHPDLLELGPRSDTIHGGSSDRRDPAHSTPHGQLSPSRASSTPRLDLAGVLRSVGAITEDLRLEEVITRLLDAALTNVGADHGLLILASSGELTLVAEAEAEGACEIFAEPRLLREASPLAPAQLINFVNRTGQSVVLDDARSDLRFAGDPYLDRAELRSVLALPLLKGERRLGVLVLENRLTTHGFSPTSVEGLRLITNQAASTLENAQLYAELRRSENRWRSLVDGAPDLIALLDERGRVVFRNHGGPLTSIDESEESEDGGRLDSASAARWTSAVETVLREGERRELELEYLDQGGEVRWYAVRVAPIDVQWTLGSGPEVIRRNAVAVATDISERKRAEAEKQALEAQLRQQQRLESVGTLASGVAHEINNPVQGIMNYADLIRANLDDRPLIAEFADEINHESNRVATIVRNLLAFSRQDAAAEAGPTQLGEVVEGALSLIRAVLRKDQIDVEFAVATKLPTVTCRAQQIQQIIMNLVTNARDALNDRYGDYDDRKRIEIFVGRAQREGWLEVAVRDTGPGIPREVLPRIFDPFFTTKGRYEGTGLGLAVSHGIAVDHGGELEVESELGVGTCFRLLLPSDEGREARMLPRLDEDAQARARRWVKSASR